MAVVFLVDWAIGHRIKSTVQYEKASVHDAIACALVDL